MRREDMENRNLTIDREGHVAVVTLNRPERHNALSRELMLELEAAVLDFREDVETRVVIFTGAGKHFCAGMDLKDPEQARSAILPILAKQRRFHLGPRLIRALREMNQINTAATNGGASG